LSPSMSLSSGFRGLKQILYVSVFIFVCNPKSVVRCSNLMCNSSLHGKLPVVPLHIQLDGTLSRNCFLQRLMYSLMMYQYGPKHVGV
jgi:hypothetical protein